jgi:tripartite-type tricarboxylate transporter receptor subunit TctC
VLNREIVATLNLPDVRERLSAIGLEVIGSSAEQLTAYLPGELEKWGRAVRLSGARVD